MIIKGTQQLPSQNGHIEGSMLYTNGHSSYWDSVQNTPIRAGFHLYDINNNFDNMIINNNDGTVTVLSAGCDFYNEAMTEIRHHDIETTIVTLVTGEANYIYADRDTNTYKATTTYSIIDDIHYVILAAVYFIFTTPNYYLHTQITPALGYGGPENRGRRTLLTNRYARQSGFDQMSVSVGLELTGNGGVMWAGDIPYNITSISSSTLCHFCYHVGGVWNTTISINPHIDNLHYDNGQDLVNLTGSGSNRQYTINYIYRGIENEDHVYIILGTQAYGSETLAKGATTLHAPPDIVSSHAVLIGRVIVGRELTTFLIENIATTPIYGSATPVTNHNDLALLDGGKIGEYYHLTQSEYSTINSFAITSGDLQIDSTYGTIEVNTSAVILTLPSAVGLTGKLFNIINTSVGDITITSSSIIGNLGTDTTISLGTGLSTQLISNGTNWRTLNVN